MDTTFLLRANGLSKTRNRQNILKLLEAAGSPVSGKEICRLLPEKCDKSTVYRTLSSLYEKNIIQRIIIDYEVKYALRGSLGNNEHLKDHIHFKCTRCNKLFCMKDIEVQDYQLPEGFVPEENQFLVMGKCKSCQ